MALVFNKYRAVTPSPYGNIPPCNSLAWQPKGAQEVLDFWLDASQVETDLASFAASVINGDASLTIGDTETLASQFGMLFSNGTAGTTYVVRVIGTTTDARIFTWDVSLPIAAQVATND